MSEEWRRHVSLLTKDGVNGETDRLVFVCVPSVPIIATVVQEELETGFSSSGDASSATTTVKTKETRGTTLQVLLLLVDMEPLNELLRVRTNESHVYRR